MKNHEDDGGPETNIIHPGDDRPSPQHIIEGVILRRLHEKRIEGYTLEMSEEIAEALSHS